MTRATSTCCSSRTSRPGARAHASTASSRWASATPSGEEVEFDVLDETTTSTPSSTKPTATIVDPTGPDGSIDVSRIVGQQYVDVAFHAPGGALLDYASILDSTGTGANELTLTRGSTSLGTLGPKPTPITTLTTDTGIALVPLVYDSVGQLVYRFSAERTVVTGTLAACKSDSSKWDCREEVQDLGSGPVTVVTAHTTKVTVVTKAADSPAARPTSRRRCSTSPSARPARTASATPSRRPRAGCPAT